jgi:hypothetical protein
MWKTIAVALMHAANGIKGLALYLAQNPEVLQAGLAFVPQAEAVVGVEKVVQAIIVAKQQAAAPPKVA